jgi:hypothetical protein
MTRACDIPTPSRLENLQSSTTSVTSTTIGRRRRETQKNAIRKYGKKVPVTGAVSWSRV